MIDLTALVNRLAPLDGADFSRISRKDKAAGKSEAIVSAEFSRISQFPGADVVPTGENSHVEDSMADDGGEHARKSYFYQDNPGNRENVDPVRTYFSRQSFAAGKSGKYDRDLLAPPTDAVRLSWWTAIEGLSPSVVPCPGFHTGHCPLVRRACLHFLASDLSLAAATLGWRESDLFGVHHNVGVARMDTAGALILSGGRSVVSLTSELIRYAGGLAYRRCSANPDCVPIWEAVHG